MIRRRSKCAITMDKECDHLDTVMSFEQKTCNNAQPKFWMPDPVLSPSADLPK